MRKIYFIFSVLLNLNCIDTPDPDLIKSSLLINNLYNSLQGCSMKLLDASGNERDICLLNSFSLCGSQIYSEENARRKAKLKEGIRQIGINNIVCSTDAYDQLQFLSGLAYGEDPYLAKGGFVFPYKEFNTNFNCQNKTSFNNVSNQQIQYLFDPSIYLAIASQNANCRLSIALSDTERKFINDFRSNSIRYFAE